MKIFLLTLIAIALFVPFLDPAAVSATGEDGKELLELVNRERKKAKADALEWDEKLAKFARAYSKEMADENSISHTDKRGRTIEQRLRDDGIENFKNAGENLFVGSGGKNYQKTAVKMWLRSASHKRNMLSKDFTRSAIGIAKGSNGTVYIAQIFVEPME